MKFSGKMYLKITLKVTKNEGFTLSLEDTFFEKPQGGVKLTPSRFRLKAKWNKMYEKSFFKFILFLKYCVSELEFRKQYNCQQYSKYQIHRISRTIFFKLGVVKNFANFKSKHLSWSLFLIKLQTFWPATLLKRDSNAGVFL